MKWNVGTKIATGFGLSLVIFMLVGAASYFATSELIQASNLRKHSYLLLEELDRVLPLLREAELGSRSYYLTEEQGFLEESRAAAERLPGVLQRVRAATLDNPRQQQRLDALEPLVRTRLDHVRNTSKLFGTEGLKGTMQRIKSGQSLTVDGDIARLVGEMQAEGRALLKERVEEADTNGENARRTIVLGTGAALALALLAGFLITRNISVPLQQLTACAERIKAGDIRVDVPAKDRSDEVGALALAFGQMTHYLREIANAAEQMAAGDLRTTINAQSADDLLGIAFQRMSATLRQQIGDIVEAANVLGASASEIVASTAQLAASASQSAAAVAETTATVEEVRQTAELASQKARHVSDTAQKAVQGSHDGRKSADDVGAGMTRIRQQMDAIATSMAGLSEHNQTIGQIIATVEDLAVQSNLLAVNAAIEAAKAGEHGKGFGVVAQEVRSLAAQSRQATGEVRAILGDIQAAAVQAVTATQQGGQAVEAGSRQTEIASDAIQALAGSVGEAAQAATQIAASSQQQLVGVDQVAAAMESIKQASSQNMVSARQLETAARNLNETGQRLQRIVAGYSL
ncbi:methyl-accepting chemotaxis protein [Ramlibacter algicola]|uniref:CHASE3 domain-containing protein n=1 Tax=Ramlibacter algicola TaxID=2795217 RepID=A0A934Q650_9BURK|nr:methyl-accepting chemotaxis protein [Ramlibacter algicola]MBK0394887.1 CHASE3 domain-containing protein [Ramlibacter algicola]